MSLHGHSKPITLTRPTSKMDPVENVSVVLPNDVHIPGSSKMEVDAVLH